MAGKLILITGSNSGIGLEAAKILAAEGHTVIATVRSAEKGDHTISEVQKVAPQADISYMILELTDFNSISNFTTQLLQTRLNGRYIDVLINNAGGIVSDRHETCPELGNTESCIAANALGPLLLTELLLDHMKQSAEHQGEARIVFVNSSIITLKLFRSMFNPNDLWIRNEENFIPNKKFIPYKTAKETLMMGAQGLAIELGVASKLKINSLCPGAVTSTWKNDGSGSEKVFMKLLRCCECMLCCVKVFQTGEEGGEDIAAVAVRSRGENTGYFYSVGKQIPVPSRCQDRSNQQLVLREMRKLLRQLQGFDEEITLSV